MSTITTLFCRCTAKKQGHAGRRGPDDRRVRLLPVSEHPRVARLLHHFIDTIQYVPLVTVALAETNFWAVTPSEQSKPWTAATMSDWLSTTVRLVGAAPPAGTSWISHSLRRGAAFAANAIGVPLSHIRYRGGWATNSDVVLDYIDPNVLASFTHPAHGSLATSPPSATSTSNMTPQRWPSRCLLHDPALPLLRQSTALSVRS